MNISLYEDSDFKIFSEYINKFFKPNYILGYKEYINWQYENSLYILKIENRVAGHFGFRDIPYKIGHNVENVRVLMNLFVVPGLRTMGAGAFLAKKFLILQPHTCFWLYTNISKAFFLI